MLASCECGNQITEEIHGKNRDICIEELRKELDNIILVEKKLIDVIRDSDYYKNFSSEMSSVINSLLDEIENDKKKCKEFLKDEVMLTDQEIEGLKENDDLKYIEEWFSKSSKEEIFPSHYVYENVKELGADNSDNDCRDEDEDDEEFGDFLLHVPGAGVIELISGRILWLQEV